MSARRPVRVSETPLEKDEQAAIVELVETLRGKAWVIGTVRPDGDFRGTCQTAGIADLWVTLPAGASSRAIGIWWETKRRKGKRSAAQLDFAEWCIVTGTPYGYGTCDEFIARMKIGGWLK